MQTKLIFEYPAEWADRKFYPKVTLVEDGEKRDSGLLGFFALMKPKDYSCYFESVLEKKYFQFYETGGITFGPQEAIPWDGVTEVKENEVIIGVLDEKIKLPYNELIQYARGFALAISNVLQVKPHYFGLAISESIKSSVANFLHLTELSGD